MVMPTDVLPYETRARCDVNDFLDSEPGVSVRNVHHPDQEQATVKAICPNALEVADGRLSGLKG
jgi:hypothetical protein